MTSAAIETAFPGLAGSPWSVTSPIAREYNCIAWAAGRDDVWMWPDSGGFSDWPDGVPREETIEAFVELFERLGYAITTSADMEEHIEKVAIFAVHQKPTHAARQLPDGTWTSKCGKDVDITHLLPALEGEQYGKVCRILKRLLQEYQVTHRLANREPLAGPAIEPPPRSHDSSVQSSSDVLIFNSHPVEARIASVGTLALGLGGLGILFSHPFSISSLFVAAASLFFLFRAYVGLTRTEELLIDFSQHMYRLRTGNLWDQPIAISNLDDIDHLHIAGFVHGPPRDPDCFFSMYLELLWRGTPPQGWPPNWWRRTWLPLSRAHYGKGFRLKWVKLYSHQSRSDAKRELESVAALLTRRLRIPVIDDITGEQTGSETVSPPSA
jgi:hypothetical protein